MSEWRTRRASLRDKPVLADLCRASVGPDDYVLEYLEDLLLRAVTYVALDGDRIVGMMTYSEVFDGSAWLGQARTLPEYRQRGVAASLTEALEGLARMKGLHALRLLTEATNRAGVASFQKMGFREVARFARMGADASARPTRARIERKTPSEELWTSLAASPIVRQGSGYVGYEYVFVPLNRGNFHYLANLGDLWGWDGIVLLIAEAGATFPGPLLNVSPLAGDARTFFRELPALAKARGAPRVETFVPHDRELIGIAAGEGLEPASWGQEAILAEKLLSGATVARRTRKTYAEIYAATRPAAGHASGHSPPGVHEDRWNP